MLAATLASVSLLPGVFSAPLAEVKPNTPLPILLPAKFDNKGLKLYGSGKGGPREYQFFLATRPNCDANVCSVAWFSAFKGGSAYGSRTVKLAKGRKGKYSPMSCGASCSPASITWKERGVVYEIQTGKSKTALVKLANSAIKKGPR
jgi:hypothetical protein